MKLSKSLLQAILIGATAGTIGSCTLIEPLTDKDKAHTKDCEVIDLNNQNEGDIIRCGTGNGTHTANCPACGMG